VLPGAVALLGLEGLLRHRACAGSSPSGLGIRPSSTPEGTQTRRSPDTRAGRVHRPADDRSPATRPSNERGREAPSRAPARRRRTRVRNRDGYSLGVSRIRLAGTRRRCYVSPPEAPATRSSRPSRASVAAPFDPAAIQPTVPRHQRVHIDLWTRSRSGAPPSASSR
jgi:hypothetical protein